MKKKVKKINIEETNLGIVTFIIKINKFTIFMEFNILIKKKDDPTLDKWKIEEFKKGDMVNLF